jgi:hypothetical protein
MFGKYNGFVSKARVSACMYFLVKIYKRPGFNLKSTPDIEFNNERDIDGGGLTR